jgi:two-component system CheB/CheR fusion protein
MADEQKEGHTGGKGGPALVVGVGASAGGLEALERLFTRMPTDTGCAFIVVQHLSPDFKSMMDELLGRCTKIPIRVAEDGVPIGRDCIYLNPPRKQIMLRGGHLFLTDKDPVEVVTHPIDHFFRSLAQDAGPRAVAVVLSGTGSDGSRGLRDVHAAGGMVVAQIPESAGFDGMPRSALDTGLVHRSLAPEEIPEALLDRLHRGSVAPALAAALPETGIEMILRLLRGAYGIDFSNYKPSTILRRIERRAELARVPTPELFAVRLSSSPAELDQLYRDLLIGVTRFFRDVAAFERLGREVISEIVRGASRSEEIRIWVAGCATGEEAYSLAILLREAMEDQNHPVPVKIFATDVHHDSLAIANSGVYGEETLANVSPERRDRFFTPRDGRYQVIPELRAMVVFAPHDVLKDAPFIKLDLVTCRNLLIYFETPAQHKALSLFHFSLKTKGALFLGPSETLSDLAEEFEEIDQHWKLFRKRRDIRLSPDVRFSVASRARPRVLLPAAPAILGDSALLGAYGALLDELLPPCFLVNARRELTHSFGGASRFLRVRDGRLSTDVADMLDGDLRVAVVGALQRVFAERIPVIYRGLRADPTDEHVFDLTARPVRNRRTNDVFAVVMLQETLVPRSSSGPAEVGLDQASREHVSSLEGELRYTRENLQATIEELETSNEELQAANEELVASNEQLQSTNEELHSVNEELHTVNAEYQRKILEQLELNADMDHLLASTEVHTLFLDQRLCIRKFTPRIAEVFSLLPQDLGRSIEAFTHSIQHPGLVAEIRRVAGGGEPFGAHVQDTTGRWFLLRILPYRRGVSLEGAVLTLIDVSGLRRAESEVRRMNLLLGSILRNSPNQITIKDRQRRFVVVDDTFRRMVGKDPVGATVETLFSNDLAGVLSVGDDAVLERGAVIETEISLPGPEGPQAFLAVKFPLREPDGSVIGVGGIHTNITSLKRAEQEARLAVAQRDRFLATLSHELRNPLAAVLNAASVLDRLPVGDEIRPWKQIIIEGARHMDRLLDDLLDVARVTQDKMAIVREQMDLRDVVSAATEAVASRVRDKRISLTTSVAPVALMVDGDRARLLQVVSNLLVNAVRYTPEGGRVLLGVLREGDCAAVHVTDSGIGIDSRMLGHIFEPFVQAQAPGGQGRDGGLGVGLALVRHIVSLHGGTVLASSDGEGKGSEFVVRIPLVVVPAVRVAPPASEPLERHVVLLVEDDEHSRRALTMLMEMDGLQVVGVGSGEAALEAFPISKPAVVLLDVGLPGINGLETCRRLRALPGGQTPTIIALTGFGQDSDRAASRDAGFDAHATKPVELDEIYAAIRSVPPRTPG